MSLAEDNLAQLRSLPAFKVKQRLTAMVNRYEILRPDGAGGTRMLAFAQQKRMAFKEQVTFYADDSRTQPVFGFKSRQKLDVHGVTDVFDAAGTPIGTFSKDFGASLLRSTWYLDQPGLPRLTGVERGSVVAILRRTMFEFLPYHFDFTTPDGAVAFSVDKKFAIPRDAYDVRIELPGLDRRLVAAMAVALDALQGR